ncbi:MAG: BCCT family transporter [Marinovum algicola]|uniref:Betaine/carnitine transporter, BCCT family n=1 Tax=Marinovum algicola TaxID=42444 RepID=A0A975W6F6_9RHOB|nr:MULTISPECIES: BCCT family transporter [Marinovum]AKO95781.1 High-affinity choline uptake protein BetT [Marinovum algicola DG 898]MDD9741228.1 BCCT family transporter [Marinovum sp. SP66]MDD9743591.1 BCCT family transporter [Marinovum sp. PR37]SEI53888.1 betaine/carnitine transporter, BCCT family [Marinovum algicola]SLN29316.1 Glycine betaine transporter OpuD [Marinovum algicola]
MTDINTDQGIPAPEGAADIIETDYEIGQDNIETKMGPIGLDIHNPVFLISGLSIVAFVAYALVAPGQAGEFFGWLRPALTSNFDWFFLWSANIFVLFCLFLIVSPWGSVRLGGRDATPDYGYPGWFAMLFAAGMGIGLMFFGVLEPVYYFGTPWGDEPLGVVRPFTEDGALIEENVAEARRMALAATSYHWALHPWAIYAVVALALALFTYNKGLPLTIRSAFYPIFGERVWGWTGHIIDTLAVFATLFGLATSLGFGAQQANAGLEYVYGLPNSITVQVILIIAITAVALISVLRGLDGGVKVLSEINMVIALLLLVFVLVAAGAGTILSEFGRGILAYFQEVIPLSNPHGREDTGYMQGWTAFYWAWWISWSPFVGMFIARVSRGRTVREFVTCVLIIPSFVCLLWMAVFGGAAIEQVIADPAGSAVKAQVIDSYNPPLSLFAMLEGLPFAAITSTIGIILVIVFFVTSSDSGSLVIDTITAGGKVDAPMPQRVFWCTFEGLVAIALLIGGGLGALQAMVISTGLPFTVILLLICVAIIKGLRAEPRG